MNSLMIHLLDPIISKAKAKIKALGKADVFFLVAFAGSLVFLYVSMITSA